MNQTIYDDMSVRDARKSVRNDMKSGCECPVCGRYTKIYKRKITSSMALGLYAALNNKDNNFFHAETFFKSINVPHSVRGDFPKLRFWGFIKERDDHCGYYRVTLDGQLFVNGDISTQKYIYLYNNTPVYIEGNNETTTFKQALGDKFNLKEIFSK